MGQLDVLNMVDRDGWSFPRNERLHQEQWQTVHKQRTAAERQKENANCDGHTDIGDHKTA